jgi:hypothetical protein
MNEEDPIRKCDKCKESKSRSLFYKYQYCKRCHIKDYISYHLLIARVANRLNLSIDEINNILDNNIDNPTRNGIGEHERYNEVMLFMTGHNMPYSTVITDNIINNFLDE